MPEAVPGQLWLNSKFEAVLCYLRVCLETKQQMKTRSWGSRKRKGSEPRCSSPRPHQPSPQRAVEWLGSTHCTGAQVCALEGSCVPVGLTLLASKNSFQDGSASPPTPWLPMAQLQPRRQPDSAAGLLCSLASVPHKLLLGHS